MFDFELIQLNNIHQITNFIINSINAICGLVLFTAIVINFVETKTERSFLEAKNIVTTFTMTLFFISFYVVLKLNFLRTPIFSHTTETIVAILSTMVVVLGTIVNILGRVRLNSNWGDHIKIYDDHTLVTIGVYSIVRHPLYASLIWIFFALSIMVQNIPAFLMNVFIFVPFMYYRAKSEENLLLQKFKEYKKYRLKTPMFFPKLFNRLKS